MCVGSYIGVAMLGFGTAFFVLRSSNLSLHSGETICQVYETI